MSQILVPAWYCDSKHMILSSTRIAKCGCAMVHSIPSLACLCRCLHLSMSLSTLLSHPGTVLSLPQEQEEGLEAGLFMYCQRHTVYRVILHPKNVRNGGVETYARKTEQMAAPRLPASPYAAVPWVCVSIWGTSHFLIWCQVLPPRVPLKIFTKQRPGPRPLPPAESLLTASQRTTTFPWASGWAPHRGSTTSI